MTFTKLIHIFPLPILPQTILFDPLKIGLLKVKWARGNLPKYHVILKPFMHAFCCAERYAWFSGSILNMGGGATFIFSLKALQRN